MRDPYWWAWLGFLLVLPALALGNRAEAHAVDQADEFRCLALNVYHEARGESFAGKLAVAAVTMNRVASARYPDHVCGVVWQRGQFSWTHDGRPDTPYERDAWEEARFVAALVMAGWPSEVGRALHFHAVNVRPGWASKRRRVARVGRHVFYE